MNKNPATSRTKEELNIFYQDYLKGLTLKEISLKYKTDAGYQLNKYGYLLRKTHKTKKIRQNKGLSVYYNKYLYKFENINNEIEAYIVGLWFSDGWVSKNQAGIRLHKNDKKILETIKDYICPEITVQSEKNSHCIVLSNSETIDNLISLGCLRNKTYKSLQIPYMKESLKQHFIRGYFDGDGTVFKDRIYIKANICSINKNFLLQIKEILDDANINSKIYKEIRKNKTIKIPGGFSSNCKDMYRLVISKKKEIETFKNYLYGNSTVYMQRKFNKFNYDNVVLTN
jgi:hypothetical protein